MVSFQLKEAELLEGRVVAYNLIRCARRFETDELNVTWAELVAGFGPSPYRLGLMIPAIAAGPVSARHAQ